MKKLKNEIIYLIVFLSSSFSLFLYGYLGSFTRFMADDYCSAYYAEDLGLFGSIFYWYRTWSGRYSAYGADWLVLNLFDSHHINLIPPIALGLWLVFTIITIYLMLQAKKDQGSNSWHAIIFAAMALYLVMLLNPNVPQSFYWWNGMRSYTLPLIVLIFGILVFQIFEKRIKTNIQIVIVASLSFAFFFANGGLSETYVVLQLAFLTFLLFLSFFFYGKRKITKESILLFAGLLGTLASLATILHSHGNVIRRSVMPPAPDLVTLLTISFDAFFTFISEIVLQKEKIFAFVGAILIAIWIGRLYKDTIFVCIWEIVLFFGGGVLLMFGTFLPGVYGYAQFPPTRTLIIGVFMCLIFFLYGSFLLGAWLALREKFHYGGVGLAIIASILILVSTTITTKSLYETRGIYIAFAEKWDRVDAEILEAKAAGASSITTEAMNNWAGLDRPNDNPKWWPTECYSLYYDFLVMGPPY